MTILTWRRLVPCVVLIVVLNAPIVLNIQVKSSSQRAAQISKLRKHDRSRLAEARAQNQSEVILLIAAKEGKNDLLVREITSAGGTIGYRADDVSYLRATLAIDKVEQIASAATVDAINLEGSPDYYGGATFEETQQQGPVAVATGPDRNTPAENPYLPTRDIGAPQFIKANPTFDGRGVTIAVIEDIPDLLSPELQSATTLDGRPTRKILGIVNAVDPADDDVERVQMTEVSATDNRKFEFNSVTYQVAALGRFRFGLFDTTTRPQPGFPLYTHFSYFSRVNLAANPLPRSPLFGVLWDERSNTVWVDTNQNHDFSDDKPMNDYNINHDVGVIGTDDPATVIRDTVPFSILLDAKQKFVTIGIGTNSHTTGVASAAAGKAFFGGKMNGSAPEAQLVIVRSNLFRNYSPIEGTIAAFRNPAVDLVTMAWGLIMRLNDGNSVLDLVFDRLIERYNKPLFTGVSNGGPALNTAYETTERAVIVGGYTSAETWQANYSLVADKVDNVNNLASRGPREDGGFKPDILTPVDSLLAASSLSQPYAVGQAYKLPAGYQQTLGTSFSGPMAAGGAALLISAARQAKVKYDASRIKWALKASARFLPQSAAHEQGAGLMNVVAAWEALKNGPASVSISSTAPVKTALSNYLREPDRGPGIYEREGWTAGDLRKRVVTFTRTSGAAWPVTYNVTWTGNDGTFSSAETIALPLNVSRELQITVNPRASGVHSALLNLIDEKTAYPVYQVMNTIVAAEQLSAANGFAASRSGEAPFLGWKSYFVYVPPDTEVLKVDMTVSNGNVKLNFFDPSGTSYFTSHPRTPGKGLVKFQEGGSWSRAFEHPEPGVWEIIIINDNTNKEGIRGIRQQPARFNLSAALLNVSVKPWEFSANRKSIVDLVNESSTFNGGIQETDLGSAFSKRVVLRTGRNYIREIDVPNGTSSLEVRIRNASPTTADLDLYVYDCTGEKCLVFEHSVGGSANESIRIEKPSPGKWKAFIDVYKLSSGAVSFDYLDVFTHPDLGKLIPTSGVTRRGEGARWSDEVQVKVGDMRIPGRRMMTVVRVTAENANSVEYRISGPPILRPVVLGSELRFHSVSSDIFIAPATKRNSPP